MKSKETFQNRRRCLCHVIVLVMLLALVLPHVPYQAEAAPAGSFLFYVEEVFSVAGKGTVITGRVEAGEVNVGDQVKLYSYDSNRDPVTYSLKVEAIEMFRKNIDSAKKGDNVGILLGSGISKNKVNVGDALTSANVTWRNDRPILRGRYKSVGTTAISMGETVYLDRAENCTYPVTVKSTPLHEPIEPGTTVENVFLGDEYFPRVYYVGQELKVTRGGKTIGSFTITEITDQVVERITLTEKGLILNDNVKNSAYERTCRFTLNKTARVHFSLICVSGMKMSIKILDAKKQKEVLTIQMDDFYNFNNVYLLSGTYDMKITVSKSGNFGQYQLKCDKDDTLDSFEENSTHSNNTKATADEVALNKTYVGSFCSNESVHTDIYKYYTHYYGKNLTVDVTSNIWGASRGEGLYYAIYLPEELEKQNGTPLVEKTVLVDADIEVEHSQQSFSTPIGLFYIVFRCPASMTGRYDFTISQDPGSEADRRTVYTTVGANVDVLSSKQKTQYNGSEIYYESLNSSVANVKDPAKSSVYAGYPGTTTVYGYGQKWPESFVRVPTTFLTETTIHVEFKDVIHGSDKGKNPYYYDAVYWAAENEITEGYKDSKGLNSTFKPQNECTRSQMLTFLWRMAGSPEPLSETYFSDVKKDTYFYKAVCWATENNITVGYSDGTFRPQNNCTRGQAVTFLYRMDGSEAHYAPNFDDVSPEQYFYDAVGWAEKHGITEGYPDGTFKPGNKCTRAQMVTFLHRYQKYLDRNKDIYPPFWH